MATVEEMWPDLAPKTLSELANNLGISEEYLWRFINAHDLPWPLQIETGKWVYPPFAYKAAMQIMNDLLREYPEYKAVERYSPVFSKECKHFSWCACGHPRISGEKCKNCEEKKMSDRDASHLLEQLQQARSHSERLEKAIERHRWEMREYKGAFFDEALWQAIAIPEVRSSDGDTTQTNGPGRAGDIVGDPE